MCVRDDSARRLVANWRSEGQVGLRSGKNCWHSCSIATRKSLTLFFFMSIYFDPTKNRQKARKITKNQNTLLGKRIWDSNSNGHFRVPFNILCGSLAQHRKQGEQPRGAMFSRSPPSRSLPEAKVGGPTKGTPRERSARMPVAVARYERRDRHVRAERARRSRTGPGDLGRRQTRGATGGSRVVFHIRSRI